MPAKHQTAAMLVIGNEILSGRTRDANSCLVAQHLFKRGCKLAKIIVVADIESDIVASLKHLKESYDAVITSGGIGPTHDDITMQCVARVFDAALIEDENTLSSMVRHYGKSRLNSGRKRMARLPGGAAPIVCRKSIAPGAHIGNVYVLAGVPDIFASQLGVILDDFGDKPFIRRQIDVTLPESSFAASLEGIQEHYPDVEIGSYPHRCGNRPEGKICLSSQDELRLDEAVAAVQCMLEHLA